MPDTDQHPALTFVMSTHHLLGIVRQHLPGQETVIRLDGLARTGLGAAEVATGAALLADPDPVFSKIGGAALIAHGTDTIIAGNRAWNTGLPAPTMTERAARAAAMMAHTSPVMANVTGATVDAIVPAGIIHAIGTYAATSAIRIASADAQHLVFDHRDVFPEHFHQPAPEFGQPANRNLLAPHRQDHLDLARHEAPSHDRRAGGHVLLKHVSPTDEFVERRFIKEKLPTVSFFTSKHEAEQTIHSILQDNGRQIEEWLETGEKDESLDISGHISGRGTVVIDKFDRAKKKQAALSLR